MEREVIADIARRIKKTGRYTETAELMAKSMRGQGYSTAKIQAEVMKLLRADKAFQMTIAENTKAYKQMVTNLIKDTVYKAKLAGDKLIAEAGMMGFNNDLSMWRAHGVNLKKPNSMNQLMNAFKIQTANELKNLTRTTGFKNTALGTTGVLNAYQRELDLAVLKVATGTFSYDQAVNDCVHRLAKSGLRSIDYASGRSYQLDTAVRMATRTGVSQLAGRITEMNLKSTGQDLVITSQHMGSRPEHAPIQNKVFSYSGKNKKYPDFKAPIGSGGAGYGMADGIKGVNCTHNFYPYWEGDYIPEDIEYDETYYQNTQKQRAMERNIRATKREIEAQKAIGGDTKDLQARLRKQTADYRSFSDSVGIRAKDNRLRVASGTSDLKKTKNIAEKRIHTDKGITKHKEIVEKSTKNNIILLQKEETDQTKHLTREWSQEAIERRTRDEKIIRGLKKEKAILYDASGSRVFQKNGAEHSVKFTQDEIKKMHGGVLTHNHPEGASFSPADINMMRISGLKEIRAVGRDGVYVLKQPNEWDEKLGNLGEIKKQYAEIEKELEDTMTKWAQDNLELISVEDYQIRYQDAIMRTLSERFGLEYEMEVFEE